MVLRCFLCNVHVLERDTAELKKREDGEDTQLYSYFYTHMIIKEIALLAVDRGNQQPHWRHLSYSTRVHHLLISIIPHGYIYVTPGRAR